LSIPGAGQECFDLHRRKHLASERTPPSLIVGANIPSLAKMLTG
jgi:hypothetical protein